MRGEAAAEHIRAIEGNDHDGYLADPACIWHRSAPGPFGGVCRDTVDPLQDRRTAVHNGSRPLRAEVGAQAISPLEPRARSHAPAVAGEGLSQAFSAKVPQHVTVVGPERDGHPGNRPPRQFGQNSMCI